MPAETFFTLSREQKEQVRSLAALCCAADGTALSFPEEEGELYLLYCDESGRLLSAAAFFPEGEDGYGCSAFTLPEFRNRGLFSLLLDKAQDLLPEKDFFFYVDERASDTMNVLEVLGAERLSAEYMMERPAGPAEAPALSVSLTRDLCPAGDAETPAFLYACPYGSLTIAGYGDFFYLYGFEILPEYRGMGYGTAFLSAVLSDLAGLSPRPVRLQVSGSNRPALALYEKTGFRVIETLSCFLY